MIVSKQSVKEVDCFGLGQVLVVLVDEITPGLARIPAQNSFVMRAQLKVVFVEIRKQIVRSENFGNFDELIVVVSSMEKRFLSENLFLFFVCFVFLKNQKFFFSSFLFF